MSLHSDNGRLDYPHGVVASFGSRGGIPGTASSEYREWLLARELACRRGEFVNTPGNVFWLPGNLLVLPSKHPATDGLRRDRVTGAKLADNNERLDLSVQEFSGRELPAIEPPRH